MSNRRKFLRAVGLGALGTLAGHRSLAIATNKDSATDQVGYAVLGLGNYASYVVPRLAQSQKSKVVAFISSDRAKAKTWADRWGAPHHFHYDDLERIANMNEIQAVYICTPVGLHADFAIRCMKAGKHVITEKTMAANTRKAEEMIRVARAQNVKLMVAYRARFDPFTLEAIRYCREQVIGEPVQIVASKGFLMGDAWGKNKWRMNTELAGGGALTDIGIYSVQACRYLAGEEPVSVTAQMVRSQENPDQEKAVSFTLQFKSGVLAAGHAGWNHDLQNYYRVVGSSGWFEINPATSNGNLRFHEGYQSKRTVSERYLAAVDQIPLMFDHFSTCILKNEEPLTNGDEGLRDVKVIEALYEAARKQTTVHL